MGHKLPVRRSIKLMMDESSDRCVIDRPSISVTRNPDKLPSELLEEYDPVGQEPIAEGAFAVVRLMRKRDTAELFALKCLEKYQLKIRNMTAQMERELRIHQAMNHPNILKLIRAYDDHAYLCMLVEFCCRGPLSEVVAARPECRFAELEAAFYFQQIASGVDWIHRRLCVHRDLKLSNMLLTEKHELKVADFGWSAEVERDAPLNCICGTFAYWAPEIWEKVDQNIGVDLWSMGCMLYEMLAGHLPFFGNDQQEVRQKVLAVEFAFPPWFSNEACHLVHCLLQREPLSRIRCHAILGHAWLCDRSSESRSTAMEVPVSVLQKTNAAATDASRGVTQPASTLAQHSAQEPSLTPRQKRLSPRQPHSTLAQYTVSTAPITAASFPRSVSAAHQHDAGDMWHGANQLIMPRSLSAAAAEMSHVVPARVHSFTAPYKPSPTSVPEDMSQHHGHMLMCKSPPQPKMPSAAQDRSGGFVSNGRDPIDQRSLDARHMHGATAAAASSQAPVGNLRLLSVPRQFAQTHMGAVTPPAMAPMSPRLGHRHGPSATATVSQAPPHASASSVISPKSQSTHSITAPQGLPSRLLPKPKPVVPPSALAKECTVPGGHGYRHGGVSPLPGPLGAPISPQALFFHGPPAMMPGPGAPRDASALKGALVGNAAAAAHQCLLAPRAAGPAPPATSFRGCAGALQSRGGSLPPRLHTLMAPVALSGSPTGPPHVGMPGLFRPPAPPQSMQHCNHYAVGPFGAGGKPPPGPQDPKLCYAF